MSCSALIGAQAVDLLLKLRAPSSTEHGRVGRKSDDGHHTGQRTTPTGPLIGFLRQFLDQPPQFVGHLHAAPGAGDFEAGVKLGIEIDG